MIATAEGTDDHAVHNPAPAPPLKVGGICAECGKPITGRQTKFCGKECRNTHQREVERAKYAASRPTARHVPAAPDSDHGHAGGVLQKRRQGIADKASDRTASEAAHPEVNLTTERLRFSREILPRLQDTVLSVRAIVDALGVSSAFASRIRRAGVVPHPMYYLALERLLISSPDRTR